MLRLLLSLLRFVPLVPVAVSLFLLIGTSLIDVIWFLQLPITVSSETWYGPILLTFIISAKVVGEQFGALFSLEGTVFTVSWYVLLISVMLASLFLYKKSALASSHKATN